MSWYKRNEIKRVSLDYIKANYNITKREVELLKIVNKRKMVRRDMLEIISPQYRYIGKSRTRIINRSIKKLFMGSFLDKAHEIQSVGGNTPAVVSLDRAGSVLLGIPHRQRIKQRVEKINGKEYIFRSLPNNFRHVNGVNAIEVDTILFCEKTGAEIIKWELELPFEYYYRQERIVLIVDALLILKINDDYFCIFIEYDTGSENPRFKEPPIIRDKIVKYKKYMLSRLWEDEFIKFPIVIFVSADIDRVKFWNSSCKKNGVIGLGVCDGNWIPFLKRLSESI